MVELKIMPPTIPPTERLNMGIIREFSDFLKKYQVLGLAVAFIIGAASTKLVTAIVNDLVMPIISVLIPNGDWRTATWKVGPVEFLVGDFMGALIDFLIIAIVVFWIVKLMIQEDKDKEKDKKKRNN
mgnify:CR=1 FL=1